VRSLFTELFWASQHGPATLTQAGPLLPEDPFVDGDFVPVSASDHVDAAAKLPAVLRRSGSDPSQAGRSGRGQAGSSAALMFGTVTPLVTPTFVAFAGGSLSPSHATSL
jgi:hypothetical protein